MSGDDTAVPLTVLAQRAVAAVVRFGDVVMDATAGNGHDTAFLARLVGTAGRVYAFDIQSTALVSSRQLLEADGLLSQVELLQANHADLEHHLPPHVKGTLAAGMFNLGYLPGGDKSRTTSSDSTLKALLQLLAWVRVGGLISIVAYSGHPGGLDELNVVRSFVDQLPSCWSCEILSPPQRHCPPSLFLLRRTS